uniref:feline leukemia virus subgroup C receptor-related protein 2-like n=1 Tax=Styela clava TaxID=7725 RepID=UPI00193AAF89|nr:feline leukemia virus subgroup C receptor-related protein 2-like [Styela clava]
MAGKEADNSTPLVAKETELYMKRWLVACLLFLSGFLVQFAWHFFGVINETLSEHFGVSQKTIDWLTLSAGVGEVIAGPVIGYLFSLKPTVVKIWYVGTTSVLTVTFAICAFVIYVGKYVFICIVAEVAVGFVCAVFYALGPVTATVWFGEMEQATVLGIGWFATMAAVIVASSMPVVLFGENIDLSDKMNRVALLLLAMSILGGISSLIVCLVIPNLPKLPPSHAELQRLSIAKRADQDNYKTTLLRFAKETKYVITDRTSFTLVLMFSIIEGVFVSEYMLVPANESELKLGNSTLLSDDATDISVNRGFVLTSYSIGGIVGSIGMGVIVDRLKSYNPVANIISFSICVNVVLAMLTFIYNIKVLEYISNFMYGLSMMSFYPFIQEMLKQHVYPTVQESTQGILVSLIGSVFCVLLPIIIRAVMTQFGKLQFYVIVLILFIIIQILTVSIKPEMKRFKYENEAIDGNKK